MSHNYAVTSTNELHSRWLMIFCHLGADMTAWDALGDLCCIIKLHTFIQQLEKAQALKEGLSDGHLDGDGMEDGRQQGERVNYKALLSSAEVFDP